MGKTEELINSLKESQFYRGQITHELNIGAREAHYADNILLTPAQSAYLKNFGIAQIYTHQAEALENFNSGKNTVLTTPTASGKSLAFNLPALSSIEKGLKCLYIFPAKALSNDQLISIEKMRKASGLDFVSGVYDGDTDAAVKARLRRDASLIITNPYELHQILPYHSKFTSFYSSLDLIVLDEAHRYRGVFGSNIAFLMRRLLRICSYYGSNPKIIAASGSISRAEEFMHKLTGLAFKEVKNSGAPSSPKKIIFWDPAKNIDKSAVTQAKDLLLACTGKNLQTLVFTKSRKMAESIRIWASRENKNGAEILSYRSGYSADLRRETENKFKNGIARAIVSTNALELGIDIGGLDCVIMAGYPGSVSSFWQQAGRAGRSGREAIIFFIPSEDAMERYILKYPDTVISGAFESPGISLENHNIAAGQILCAIAELPCAPDNPLMPDTCALNIIPELEKQGVLKRTARGLIYSGAIRPHDAVSLDSSGPASVKLKVDGRILEELPLSRTYNTAHKGAVHLYNGETYLIKELDLSSGEATAVKEPADYVTEPVTEEDVSILYVKKKIDFENFSIFFGDVNVTEFFKGFRKKQAGRMLGQEAMFLPPLKFNTEAVWFEISHEAEKELLEKRYDLDGSLHAAEHAMIGMAPLITMCDRNDIGGRSYSFHKAGRPCIFVYDGYEGGIGIAEKLFETYGIWLKITQANVNSCTCEKGCPSCVYSPKCGNNNEPIDKKGSLELLNLILRK